MNLTCSSNQRIRQNLASLRPKDRIKLHARRYTKVMSGWDMEPYRQRLNKSGVQYDQAVVLVDAINAGIKYAIQEVESRFTSVFAEVLKKQDKLSGEVGTVGKEVLAAKRTQARTLQEVDARFSPIFREVSKEQEKLFREVGNVKYSMKMDEAERERWRVDKTNLQKIQTDLESIQNQMWWGGIVLVFVLLFNFMLEDAALTVVTERLHPK